MSASVAGSAEERRLTTQEPTPLARLVRPAAIEAEIRNALQLDPESVVEKACSAPPRGFSSECLVHLARRDLRGERRLVEDLVPPLLRRADRSLRRNLRGPWADEAREEILGRLATLLLEADRRADFFEVRFDLALKRLRIDVCRGLRRRPLATTSIEATLEEGHSPSQVGAHRHGAHRIEAALSRHAGEELTPEERATLSHALSRLDENERRAMILRHVMGLAVAESADGHAGIAQILGVSERTVRNLLRRARRRLVTGEET